MLPDCPCRSEARIWLAALALAFVVASFGMPALAEDSVKLHMHKAKVIRDPALAGDGAGPIEYVIGQSIFERVWVSAPSSTQSADGLGPMFNARSCAGCHPGGTRGAVFLPDGGISPSLVVRLGMTDRDGADPVYGRQVQVDAMQGVAAEGRVGISFENSEATLADGTVVHLRKPRIELSQLGYGPFADGVRAGLRLGPAIHGIGPLGAIGVETIATAADPADRDGDGISGRVNWLGGKGQVAGRFGWKAVQPDLNSQNAHAFMADMGLSTELFRDAAGECSSAETGCRSVASPKGAEPGPEVAPLLLAALGRFVAESVLPPVRKPVAGKEILARGRAVFMAAGCGACHRPGFDITWPAGSGVRRHISPYTDLLLHDMGAGLGDGVTEGGASGSEWRTAPLWGLRRAVFGDHDASLLHDGRARNVTEAIMWHGGEAAGARDRFSALPATDRDALVSFLRSL